MLKEKAKEIFNNQLHKNLILTDEEKKEKFD